MNYIASIAEQVNIFLENYAFLNFSFLGNTIREYIVFLLVFLLVFIALRIFRIVVLKRIKNTIKKIGKEIGNTIILIIDTFKPQFYWFLSFYATINILNIPDFFWKILTIILVVWLAYQIVKALQLLIDYLINRYLKKERDQGSKHAIFIISRFAKWLLWLFAGLIVLSNLGVNVTSVMAGLGIGGLAIALAIQNILNDLFSSFAIFFDKPFVVGDFIIAGEHMGVVEKIGIKTTRLKALQGEEIVISNQELTSTRIQNFKKMKKRRIVFHFGLVYQTPLEKLKKIPVIVEKIIKDEKLTELDRVHFAKFADFSLDFEVVYYILSGNYNDYMDSHQNILFKMKREFEKENISMAFPTQTIELTKN